MGRLLATLCCGAALLFAADDPWAKVKAIASGTDIRIYKSGSTKPLLVKMDEANDERLVYVNKNEQTSLSKNEIERVDARPSNKRPVTKQTTGDAQNSAGNSLSIGNKPNYETVYERPAKK